MESFNITIVVKILKKTVVIVIVVAVIFFLFKIRFQVEKCFKKKSIATIKYNCSSKHLFQTVSV